MGTFNVDINKGIHNGTIVANDKIVLAPAPLFSTFPGDTDWWNTEGDSWTADGDKLSLDNPDGNNDYLWVIDNLSQSSAKKITFRITIESAEIPEEGEWAISLTLTDNGGLSGTILGHQEMDMPVGVVNGTQVSVEVTPTGPAKYLYAYVFCRNSAGSITISNTEIFQEDDPKRVYGEYTSDIFNTIDIHKALNKQVTANDLKLTKVGLYYHNLDNVDNSYSVDHSIEVLSQFEVLVCNEPGLNTSERQQYVQQQLIEKGVKLYGYNNAGISASVFNSCIPSVRSFLAIVDRCHEAGYEGIFFDGGGQPGVPMEYANYLIDYVHNLGMNCIINSHPQDRIDSTENYDVLDIPSVAPVLSAVNDETSLLAPGTYEIGYTLSTYIGETPISPISTITIGSGQSIKVHRITDFDYNAQSINIYVNNILFSIGNGLETIVNNLLNSSNPPPTENTAYTANPNGIRCHLNSDDWLLWESFYSRSDNKYAGEYGGFQDTFNSYKEGVDLNMKSRIKMIACAYQLSNISINDDSDFINAYILALGLGFSGMCYTGISSDTTVNWTKYPVIPVGENVDQTFEYIGNNEYQALTDSACLIFTAVDSPISRKSSVFSIQGNLTMDLSNIPAFDATVVNGTWQTSDDMINWTDIQSQPFVSTKQQYFRYHATLRG